MGPWLRNQSHGVREFSEQRMADLIEGLVKRNTPLIVKKIKLIDENKKLQAELNKIKKLPHLVERKHAVFLRVEMARLIYPILVCAEFFITYISTVIIFSSDEKDAEGVKTMIEGAKVSISTILTLGSAITSDEFLQNALPDPIKNLRSKQGPEAHIDHPEEDRRRKLSAGVSGVFLLFFEVCIVGLAHKRAIDFEGQDAGVSLAMIGFILAAIAIPIVAGYANWIIGQHKDQYDNTKRIEKIRKAIASNDKVIIAVERDIEKNLQLERVKYWKVIRQFNNFKTVYDQKQERTSEDLTGHFARNLETFTSQVIGEYQNQLSQLDTHFESEIDYNLNYQLYD